MARKQALEIRAGMHIQFVVALMDQPPVDFAALAGHWASRRTDQWKEPRT